MFRKSFQQTQRTLHNVTYRLLILFKRIRLEMKSFKSITENDML